MPGTQVAWHLGEVGWAPRAANPRPRPARLPALRGRPPAHVEAERSAPAPRPAWGASARLWKTRARAAFGTLPGKAPGNQRAPQVPMGPGCSTRNQNPLECSRSALEALGGLLRPTCCLRLRTALRGRADGPLHAPRHCGQLVESCRETCAVTGEFGRVLPNQPRPARARRSGFRRAVDKCPCSPRSLPLSTATKVPRSHAEVLSPPGLTLAHPRVVHRTRRALLRRRVKYLFVIQSPRNASEYPTPVAR